MNGCGWQEIYSDSGETAWRYTMFVHIQISIIADQVLNSTSRASHKRGSRFSTA